MRRALLLVAVLVPLAVAPAARLSASARCSGPASMDCCAAMADQADERGEPAAAPCRCALSPVPPAPAAQDGAHAPDVVLVMAPSVWIRIEPSEATRPVSRVPSRARSGPLNLLFSVLLV